MCDANGLIDLDIAGLIDPAFSLFRCAIPDMLFHAELAERHGYLLERGLEIKQLEPSNIIRQIDLIQRHPRPSRMDHAALALAEAEECVLLTGDESLRKAAKEEAVEVHGTVWLIGELMTNGRLTVTEARDAYARMRRADRRLPWAEIDRQLVNFGGKPLTVSAHEA